MTQQAGKKKKKVRRRKNVKALTRQFQDLQTDPIDGVQAEFLDDDIGQWKVSIAGPKDSPYEDGIFALHLDFSRQYPEKPPNTKMATPIYHLNINDRGKICIGILDSEWNPQLTVRDLLVEIVELLRQPDLSDALQFELVSVYQHNREEYFKIAKLWTQKYACNNNDKDGDNDDEDKDSGGDNDNGNDNNNDINVDTGSNEDKINNSNNIQQNVNKSNVNEINADKVNANNTNSTNNTDDKKQNKQENNDSTKKVSYFEHFNWLDFN